MNTNNGEEIVGEVGEFAHLSKEQLLREARISEYEAQGMTRSDAQGVVEAEDLRHA